MFYFPTWRKSARLVRGKLHAYIKLFTIAVFFIMPDVPHANMYLYCTVRFLQDLETRLEENVVMSKVGDVVLNHKSTFRRVYVPYVTNMMYQETLIMKLLLVLLFLYSLNPFSYKPLSIPALLRVWRLLSVFRQENRKFVLALKKLEKDPLCQRQTLKSFLILPFQRITRLRLILEVGFS